MTNEEALAHFKNHEYMTDFSWQDEMSEIAIAAIEKQVPKKLIRCRCECGRIPISDRGTRLSFCDNCGQKIDWTEDE